MPFTKHRVLTAVQAETLARLYYGLPERNYFGRPLPRQELCWQALIKRSLVTVDRKRVTKLGLTMLGWHLGKDGRERK